MAPPAAPSVPKLLVGPGTGVAPVRRFLKRRAEEQKAGRDVAKSLLFYGCRHPDHDWFYRDDMKAWEEAGIADVHLAFSTVPNPHKFVQDALTAERDAVWDILERGGLFYVCGDGRFIPLLNWDQEETARHFAADARAVLAEVVDDTRAVPGSSCVDCKALAGCAALIRTEDLLPLSPPARPTARPGAGRACQRRPHASGAGARAVGSGAYPPSGRLRDGKASVGSRRSGKGYQEPWCLAISPGGLSAAVAWRVHPEAGAGGSVMAPVERRRRRCAARRTPRGRACSPPTSASRAGPRGHTRSAASPATTAATPDLMLHMPPAIIWTGS